VVFLGAISEEAGLRIVLRAFALKPVDAILHLYGLVRPAFKDEFQTLLADVRAAGNDVEYRCTVPYDRVPALLQEYEVGLISYQPHHINQYYCSPAKLFEYIAAGLALVTPDYPGLREIIRPPRLGLCVDPTDPLALADAIGVLASERDETLLMGERARSDFEEKFNFERQAAPLLEALSGGLG